MTAGSDLCLRGEALNPSLLLREVDQFSYKNSDADLTESSRLRTARVLLRHAIGAHFDKYQPAGTLGIPPGNPARDIDEPNRKILRSACRARSNLMSSAYVKFPFLRSPMKAGPLVVITLGRALAANCEKGILPDDYVMNICLL